MVLCIIMIVFCFGSERTHFETCG